MYDLVIVGGGPGGVAAGIYAARKKIKTLLVTDSFGGQSAVSGEVQNWIGTKSISGYDLAKSLEEHLRAQNDIDIVDDDLVTAIQKKDAAIRCWTVLFTHDAERQNVRSKICAFGVRQPQEKTRRPGRKRI